MFYQPTNVSNNIGFRPVSRLVRVCGEVAAAPTESEEIAFLCTVCVRLKKEPHLAHLFLRNTDPYQHQVYSKNLKYTNYRHI